MHLTRLMKAFWGFALCTWSMGCVSRLQTSSEQIESQDSFASDTESSGALLGVLGQGPGSRDDDFMDIDTDMDRYDPTLGQTGELNIDLKKDPRKATIIKADLVRILIDSGFSRESVPKMVCTAKFESNFRLMATNLNRNGTRDSGIFQINDVWLNTCKLSREELMKPEANARCAFTVYKKQGINAWVAYQKKRSYCQKYKLEPSLAALLPPKAQKPSS